MVEIIDTAGQDAYSYFRSASFKRGEGFVLVYAINNRTIDELEEHVKTIESVKDTVDVPLVIVGNKCDLESERKTTFQQGQDFANSIAHRRPQGSKFPTVPFFETSALTVVGVDEAFRSIISLCISAVPPSEEDHPRHHHKCVLL